MKNTTLGAFTNIDDFVKDKVARLSETEKRYRDIYRLMVRESDNIFCETTNGYAVEKTTYRQFAERTAVFARRLHAQFEAVPHGAFIGLYMANSERWLELFWGLLMAGYRPLLLNTMMSSALLEDLLRTYEVPAVLSDGKRFSVTTCLPDELPEDDGRPLPEDLWADEIALTTSGTTLQVKLCIYNGQTMYNQICDSANIIQRCKAVKKHYSGQLKQLAFLPFYHIFGLVAVFLWFGYFSRTFVFLKDLAPATIQNTIRRHQVTHIFAVPLFWNTVYDAAMEQIRRRNDGSMEKLQKGIRIWKKLARVPALGRAFSKFAFKEVRSNLFGDSISFMISGGSAIAPEVLAFFNAIGYPLADGYGMTETGITSVELSEDPRHLTSGTVGQPLYSVEYRLNEDGELLVRGKTMAVRVYQGGTLVPPDEGGWFHTHDLAREEAGRYFILGRKDDVVVGPNGENLNPDVTEPLLRISGAEGVCIVRGASARGDCPTLIVQTPKYYTAETLRTLSDAAGERLRETGLDKVIGQVVLTADPLMEAQDFKLNRTVIAKRLREGKIRPATAQSAEAESSALADRVREIFAEVLHKDAAEIGMDDNLFFTLGGTSLDYFAIVSAAQAEFGVSFTQDEGSAFSTPAELCDFLKKQG